MYNVYTNEDLRIDCICTGSCESSLVVFGGGQTFSSAARLVADVWIFRESIRCMLLAEPVSTVGKSSMNPSIIRSLAFAGKD